MYTEGFEGFENLEEAESGSPRTYRSSSETDRLLRENEKLKKSLEKEQFFNKLLDQEIQELKSSMPGGNGNYQSDYWSGKKRVSRSAFYTLLFITLVMAGYIGYGIYYDKKFDYLNLGKNIPGSRAASTTSDVEPAEITPATNSPVNANEQPKSPNTAAVDPSKSANVVVTPPPATKDSVPNIIGDNKAAAADKQKQKAAIALTPDEEYDEEEVNATLREETKPIRRPSTATTRPASAAQQTQTSPAQTTSAPPAAIQPVESKPVIAKYRVTSKANFYNGPDENTMRSTFIAESANKIVNALEDRNGFIYVEYTNDLGFTSKGWLSKQDLSKE
jgi:hypothetical protein